jgi:hypothetical protein
MIRTFTWNFLYNVFVNTFQEEGELLALESYLQLSHPRLGFPRNTMMNRTTCSASNAFDIQSPLFRVIWIDNEIDAEEHALQNDIWR